MATTHEKLQALLKDFNTAMLVTRATDGQLRSRPMALVDVEEQGTMWFLTECDSEKMEEIALDRHVNVSLQAKSKFVSISGSATPVSDRRKLDEVWNDAFKVWFPEGKDDPRLTLLKVDGKTGEYWDNSGSSGIKYLIEAGKAFFSGTRPDVEHDPKIHGKVSL